MRFSRTLGVEHFRKFFSAYTGAPLNYVIREHEEVTNELRDESAELPIDQDLYSTVVFEGTFPQRKTMELSPTLSAHCWKEPNSGKQSS
jgi:hypothetical protein